MPTIALPCPRPPSGGSILVGVGVAAAALAISLFVIVKGPALAGATPLVVAPLLVVPAWMLVTRRSALALAILLLYLGIADGFLKLQSTSEIPGLGRDFMLYAIAAGMLLRATARREPLSLPPLTGWVVAFTAVVLIQLLNPANGALLHSVASLRQHIEFVPLFFIGYAVMRDPKQLRVFFVLLLVVAAINGVVGAIQTTLSPADLSGWGPGYETLISGDGVAPRTAVGGDGQQVVRPPGLGSDMGFAGILGAIAIPAAVALVARKGETLRMRVVFAALGVGAVTGVVTSLSRSAVLAAVVALAAFILLIALAQSRRVLKVLASIIAIASLGAVVLPQYLEGRESVFARYASIAPDRVVETTIDSRSSTLSQIPRYGREFPLGAGIGSVGPAAGVIDPPPPKHLNAESQFTFMIVEIGLPGLLVFLGLVIAALAMVIGQLRRVVDQSDLLVLAALASPLVAFCALFFVGSNTTSTPNAPYFWFAIGVLSYWLGAARRAGQVSSRPVRG